MLVLELKEKIHKAKNIITAVIIYFQSRRKERKELCVYIPPLQTEEVALFRYVVTPRLHRRTMTPRHPNTFNCEN